jgi:glycosyltransferase involved in cell wall biosynthesis
MSLTEASPLAPMPGIDPNPSARQLGQPVRPASVLEVGPGWFPEFPAGAEKGYYHLCRALPAAGITVRGVTVGSERVAIESSGAIRAVCPRAASLPRRLRCMRTAIKTEISGWRPDLVACHFGLYAFPALDALRRQPLVMHVHGPWAAESAVEGAGPVSVFSKRTIERLTYRCANRFIVLSHAFGEILYRDYAVPWSRITIIPGGVDCDFFAIPFSRREARARLGWPEGRPIILAVRRLARRMGLAELISAMKEVRAALPEALLLIAGRGDQLAVLETMIADLGLSDSVELLGFVDDADLPWIYRAADLSVMPSTQLEGFGLPTAESLAAGTPVLVTPVGGLPEAVRALSPSLVLAGSKTADLAEGLVDALTGRRKLPDTETCRAYARSRFDWLVIAKLTAAAYRDSLG